jgi:hypothetical protein
VSAINMQRQPTLDELWNLAGPNGQIFDPTRLRNLPTSAQRYLQHAITDGTPLASAVRLRMHGQIKLKGWSPFSAEEVISWGSGMLWQATVRMHGVAIRGGDSFLNGRGAMRWKLFGIIPVVNASGSDITRSAAGRTNIECIWLPSILARDNVSWPQSDAGYPHARFSAHGETAELDLIVDETGRLKSVNMPRWGNPEGREFRYVNCGGFADQERTFNGYTIPTHMRVGWHFGTERFDPDGEFFRVTIDDAVYR